MNFTAAIQPNPSMAGQIRFTQAIGNVQQVNGSQDVSENNSAPPNPTTSLPGTSPTDPSNPSKNNSKDESQEPSEQQSSSGGSPDDVALTEREMKIVLELKQTDTKVRQHEMAHIAAGGQYITSGATFQFKKGPDGVSYVVGGEVSIDTSEITGDPRATVAKMKQIQSAALAPADPSAQDRKVAAQASSLAVKALSDLMIQKTKQQASNQEDQAFGDKKIAAGAYSKIEEVPEETGTHLDIAA